MAGGTKKKSGGKQDPKLAEHVNEKTRRSLAVYKADSDRVLEDAGKEEDLRHGGYGQRQVLELVQNGADQLLSSPGGSVHVVLTDESLYCANQGLPISAEGITSLLHTNISPKRGDEIGRFGLGFKSVLGVSDTPQIFSEAVSFGFDADWARSEIEALVPGLDRYPVLRMARVLDLDDERKRDPLLKELLKGATTVVRLPRDAGASEWLGSDLQVPGPETAQRGFPAEFLIFSPHVGSVILEDRPAGTVRSISVVAEDGVITVNEGDSSRPWRVFQTTLEPSAEARKEAGELSGREALPVVWAVPVEGRLEVGQFWAFFPLQDETTLSGIANAPWKVNDDRVGLLPDSLLNKELIDHLVQLVLESLPLLVKEDDPGWVLELLPARGRELRSWGDGELTTRLYELAPEHPIVPDQEGTLRSIDDIVVPPELPLSALLLWSEQASRPLEWCHWSAATTPTRRARVDRLLDAVDSGRASVQEWLEALVDRSRPDVQGAASAVRVAAEARAHESGRDVPALVRDLANARILLTDDDRMVGLRTEQVFLPSPDWASSGLVEVIHDGLAADPDTRAALETLGFVEVSPTLELRALLRKRLSTREAATWDKLWSLVRAVATPQEAARTIEESEGARKALRVRTRAGTYQPIDETLLPGMVVPETGRDEKVAVDVDFHRHELDVLRRIGMGSTPAVGYPPEGDPLFDEYRDLCRRDYQETVETSSTPAWEYLEFDREDAVGPLAPFRHLSPEGRAAFTAALLAANDDWDDWVLSHATQEKYPPQRYGSPYLWALGEYGLLETSLGPTPIDKCVGPALREWDELLAVCDLDEAYCDLLGIPNSDDDLSGLWWTMFGNLEEVTDDRLIGKFYALAVRGGARPPSTLRCRIGTGHGESAPGQIIATGNAGTFAALKDLGEPVVLAPTEEDARRIVEAWGLVEAAGHVSHQPEWIEAGGRTAVLNAFPTLREDFRTMGREELELVPCSELRMETATERGTRSDERDFVVNGSEVLYLQDLGADGLLARLDEHFELGLTDQEREGLVQQKWKDELGKRLADIREQPTDARRLLEAVGVERIRKRLPVGLLGAVEQLHGAVDDEQVAELFLVVNGYGALKALQEELFAAGLHPPERWGGQQAARAFVRDLGFSVEYAGFRGSRRDPTMLVPGPSTLPELHDYQKEMVAEIHHLVDRGGPHPRGMLSLPTGAGKTRIAVQALVEALVLGEIGSPVLWVAQSDELCEQAVQAWSEVWRAHGAETQLTISRLWGTNEVDEADTDAQVVVATPDKLRGRTESAAYQWLHQASCVVIDEAHTATTPDYTRILEWQGITQRGGTTKTRAPLIGLTATPFRGTSKEQTKRLVNRFGTLRLDKDMGERPYEDMQEMGVLSRIEAEPLEGMSLKLDASSVRAIEEMKNIPKDVYREIASDVERNRRIIESIRSKDPTWPILVFTVSTEHAHTLAALLTLEGITAASIDHQTDGGLRRTLVQEFKEGKVRVLTNYGVLSQGFDAPKTRAIYITRPTFSPNVYQQMIGRGLRGPLNGGEENCLIVNVVDNWSRFGDQLAYREFEHLWKRRDAGDP